MIAAIAIACISATLSVPADPIVRNAPTAERPVANDQLVVFTEEFFKESNEGHWSWGGGFTAFWSKGGNKTWYLRTHAWDTFAPQVATEFGIESEFTGNYRAKRIASVGADFLTERVDFSAAERPISVLLTSDPGTPDDPFDDCTVYFVGASFAPEPTEGWKSYHFGIDPFALTLPEGWGVLEGCTEPTPDDAWNRVIQDVDELRFFYGDPTFFFIFQLWTVGIDNVTTERFP